MQKDAIELMQQADAIRMAHETVMAAMAWDARPPVALPNSMGLHDLEKYFPTRRRLAGQMNTTDPDSFASFVLDHLEPGAHVFVDAEAMAATAVLNFGTTDSPGHADNRAKLVFQQTAAYQALLRVHKSTMDQKTLAEWMEDQAQYLTAFTESEEVPLRHAIAAIRNVTIEALSKVETSVGQLSQERGALESVKATSKHTIPALIYCRCQPYLGLPERLFVLRVSITSSERGPRITAQIINHEQHVQDMAVEAIHLLQGKLNPSDETTVPVYEGAYQKS